MKHSLILEFLLLLLFFLGIPDTCIKYFLKTKVLLLIVNSYRM